MTNYVHFCSVPAALSTTEAEKKEKAAEVAAKKRGRPAKTDKAAVTEEDKEKEVKSDDGGCITRLLPSVYECMADDL